MPDEKAPVPPAAETTAQATRQVSVPSATAAATLDSSPQITISVQELEAIINRSLDARLQPIQTMLAAEQAKGPGLNEIIGGIGWIIGIFALVFSLKNRKKAN